MRRDPRLMHGVKLDVDSAFADLSKQVNWCYAKLGPVGTKWYVERNKWGEISERKSVFYFNDPQMQLLFMLAFGGSNVSGVSY